MFPPDPNAPGGLRRSDYVRSSIATRRAEGTDGRRQESVSIRISTMDDGDQESVRSLAALDGNPVPEAPVVLAEIDGIPVAALGIGDGAAVADRSRVSAGTIALLKLQRLEARLLAAFCGL